MASVYAGAYWGPRKEPVSSCARRLGAFLREIGGEWHERVYSVPDLPGHVVEIDEARLGRLFLQESHEVANDADPTSTSRSGFVLGLWNSSVSVTITCGASSRHLRNSLSVSFEDFTATIPDLASARSLIAALVTAV